jgi:hypothetical protein
MTSVVPLRRPSPSRSPYAPSGAFDEETGRNAVQDLKLSLTSNMRRVESALSGSFTTDVKKAEARRLLADIEQAAKALRRAL